MFAVGYFPPSLENGKPVEFMNKVDEIAEGGECIIVGDLNARCGPATGDHAFNARGHVLLNRLAESTLYICEPEEGKRTTFARSFQSQGGWGITDLVLSNGVPIQEYKVWETETLGGSDHRPLTFEINLAPVEKSFERINIRKLQEELIQEEYVQVLNMESLDREIMSNLELLDVEEGWELLKSWVIDSATAVCGKLNVGAFSNKDFWTPELKEAQAAYVEAAETSKF